MAALRRTGDGGAAVEVVPNGQALAVVRSWLPAPADGDEEYDAVLDWGDHPEQDEPQRPARLGLGAKYLTHARAAALMDPLGRRMQRQLSANRAARLAVDGEEEEPAASQGGRGGGFSGVARVVGEKGFGRGRGDGLAAAAEPAAAHQAAADSDDDDEMRSSAFKHKRAGAAPALPLSAKKRRKMRMAERLG